MSLVKTPYLVGRSPRCTICSGRSRFFCRNGSILPDPLCRKRFACQGGWKLVRKFRKSGVPRQFQPLPPDWIRAHSRAFAAIRVKKGTQIFADETRIFADGVRGRSFALPAAAGLHGGQENIGPSWVRKSHRGRRPPQKSGPEACPVRFLGRRSRPRGPGITWRRRGARLRRPSSPRSRKPRRSRGGGSGSSGSRRAPRRRARGWECWSRGQRRRPWSGCPGSGC